jgi:hypothetical protein
VRGETPCGICTGTHQHQVRKLPCRPRSWANFSPL